MNQLPREQAPLAEVRLLLEELCCEVCRFEHSPDENCDCSQSVRFDREYYLGKPGAYADIRVAPGDCAPYIIEVKFGYDAGILIRHLKRKYAEHTLALDGISKIVLVIDSEGRPDWAEIESQAAASLASGLELEVWNETRLLQFLRDQYRIDIPADALSNLVELRHSIDRAQGYFAFGGESFESYRHESLNAELLWHLGPWKVLQLRKEKQLHPRDILPPGYYRNVVVLLADLSSFSSYVRDTPDERIVRECLTSFYSKSRYQIVNNGGMLYQFVGDEVIGLFGVPERSGNYAQAALDTAESLVSIGNSVSHHWQRQIDRVQESGGVHVGLAVGDLQIVSLKPFGRTRVGAVGDCINVSARLMNTAKSSEVVVSNSFLQYLDGSVHSKFEEMEPVDGKNVGRIKAWKLRMERQA